MSDPLARGSYSCDLCEESSLDGTAVTRAVLGASAFSRLIERTPVADVMAGLGGIFPGYVLVMPRKHVLSVGELPTAELQHLYDVAHATAAQIRSKLAPEVEKVALIEHGSSGGASSAGRACISHAHIHLFPFPSGSSSELVIPPGSRNVAGLGPLADAALEKRDYLYSAFQPGSGELLLDPRLPSQFCRRQWALALERDYEWDWAVFPYLDVAERTVRILGGGNMTRSWSSTDLVADSTLEETLRAYELIAEDYIARTDSYAAESTLPEEIQKFAKNTSGLILDAGSGSGRDSRHFADLNRDVIALDACDAFARRKLNRPTITSVHGDIRELADQRDSSVGGIWCSAVLVHLNGLEISRALRQFRRVLVPGGRLQVSVKEGTGHDTRPVTADPAPQLHYYRYTKEDLRTLAEEAGLHVTSEWHTEEPDSSGERQTWIKALITRTGA